MLASFNVLYFALSWSKLCGNKWEACRVSPVLEVSDPSCGPVAKDSFLISVEFVDGLALDLTGSECSGFPSQALPCKFLGVLQGPERFSEDQGTKWTIHREGPHVVPAWFVLDGGASAIVPACLHCSFNLRGGQGRATGKARKTRGPKGRATGKGHMSSQFGLY